MAILIQVYTYAQSAAGRSGTNNVRFICDTEAELPETDVINGDRATTNDSGKRWTRAGGAWALQTSDNLANILMESGAETAMPIGAVEDGEYLRRVGDEIVGAAAAGGAAWGSITGTLSSQTDLQSALDAKQVALVSATNIKTVNGATILGSGNLTVSAGDPSYSPGSFTVATETWKLLGNHMKLTTTQRATIQGTGRLRLSN